MAARSAAHERVNRDSNRQQKLRNFRVSQSAAQDVMNNPLDREHEEPIGHPCDIRSRSP